MQYSVIEKLNEKISKLGFGLMRLPELSEKEGIDHAEAERLIDRAYEAGVNYFDTAYVYNDGESELVAGESLCKYPRESYRLADKMPGWNLRDGAKAEDLFAEQQKRCRTDFFDFYLLHSLDGGIIDVFEKNKVYEMLRRKKENGEIRHLGFSFHGDLPLFRRLLNSYDWDFAQLQINYYDWEYSNAKSFYRELEERAIPCVVMEPVRGGSLQTLNHAAKKVLSSLDSKASPASYALRFAASMPDVMTVLSGMSTRAQLEDNLRTFNNFSPLSPAENAAVQNAAALFAENFAVPCTACRYCTDSCPAGVHIPACFAAFNRYSETRSKNDFDKEYKKIPPNARADRCIGCGTCETHCPQKILIPDRLREIAEFSAE